jgi:hypothetical protein
MPLRAGTSNDVVSSNISELERGRVVGKTRRKYGKKRAQKQAVAIALKEKRKSAGRRKRA